jgi:SnoaL-like domain
MDPLRELLEKDRIAQVINTLFLATDARDWAGVQGCLAESVLFDMTSLAGGDPARLTPAQITDGWKAGLAHIDAVHHQTGNLLIECGESEAEASCYGIAYHYRRTRFGRNTRVFVGGYEMHLLRHAEAWRIDAFRFKLKFVDGNANLEKEPPA